MAEAAFDRCSVVHAAMGSLFELSGVSTGWALGSHVAFEAGENQLKLAMARVWPDASPDSMANHAGDFASFSAGYFAARSLRRSPGGQVAVTALVAAGAGIWAWALLHGELWQSGSGTTRTPSRRV